MIILQKNKLTQSSRARDILMLNTFVEKWIRLGR